VARKRAHEHADERWLLTYADMITLLMALFMVLFSMAVVNKGKFDELAKSLRESFAGPLDHGGNSVLNVGTENPTAQAHSEVNSVPQPIQASSEKLVAERRAREQRTATAIAQAKGLEATQDRELERAKAAVDAKIKALGLDQKVKTQINSQGLVIRLVTDKVLFELGSSTIRPAAAPLLTSVAKVVNAIGRNPIRVGGHTDAVPFKNDPHGNDRLSGDRAGAVLFFLEDHGFDRGRHPDTAFQGFGAMEPLVPNDRVTGAGPRNRRVEVIVQRINYLKRAEAAAMGPLGAAPAGTGPELGTVVPKIAP
jgi:chemotaxis protein MotB